MVGKFLKTCLIIMVICVVGVAAVRAGVFNSDFTWLKEKFSDGKWEIGIGEEADIEPFFELEEQQYFNEDVEISRDADSVRDTYSAAKVHKINIKSSGVGITIAECDGEDFLVEANMVHEYQIFFKDGEVYVIARGQNIKELGAGEVSILIPSSVYHEGALEVEVESSASKVVIDRLIAKDIELEVSAGAVSWQELVGGDLSVAMSAGTVNGIGTTVTGETDMKVSAGTLTLAGVLGTSTELEAAAGKIEISLADAYNDYNYDISCAGGSVTVGEQAVEGVAKSLEIENRAMKYVDIECSVGAVNIQFAKE